MLFNRTVTKHLHGSSIYFPVLYDIILEDDAVYIYASTYKGLYQATVSYTENVLHEIMLVLEDVEFSYYKLL